MKTILFDMDGTLVDSEPVSYRAWQHFLGRFGHDLTTEGYKGMIGLRSWDSATHAQQFYGLPLSVSEVMETKRAIWESMWRDGIQVMPGLYELLGELDEQGIRWGVVTSGNYAYADEMLTLINIRQRATVLVTGDAVEKGKPDPESYLQGASLMGVKPADCWVVEDSLMGMLAGVNAGMKVFTMPNPYVDANQIPANVVTIDTLADLIPKLA